MLTRSPALTGGPALTGRLQARGRARGAIFGALLLGLLLIGSCAPDVPVPPPGPAAPADEARWVEEALASMELREEVAQLVFPWIPGAYQSRTDPEFLGLERWVEEGIGGVVISIGSPHAYAAKLNALQEVARIPLLVSSDFESGGPGMRINHSYALPSLLAQGGGTSFPPTMAFGAIGEEAFVEEMARITAVEARAVGVHLNFAPVVDVNSNPENPIINTRALGEDPETVGQLARAYIRGAREGGVLTTAKHFPGHGDTRVDSHLELPEVTADRQRLDEVELVPFRAAIDEGVDGVMTAHVSVPAVLGPDAPPATFSSEFMTDLLEGELGFDGLVITDALRMGAITERYGGGEAAVLALEAGADIILVPESVPGAIDAVVEAVESGRLSRERLQASVRKVLGAKAGLELHRERRVPLEEVDRVVGSGPHLAFADSAASRSITLPRDRENRVPVDLEEAPRVLSVTYARSSSPVAGQEFDALLATFVPEVERVRLDERSSPAEYRSLGSRAEEADLVLVSAYVAPQAGAGAVEVPAELARFVHEIDERRPLAVLSFGNPYLLSVFPDVGTYMLAWGDREVSQRAAVRALVGASGIEGRLPVTLPPFHQRGEGLVRAADPLVAERARARGDALDETGLVAGPPGGDAEEPTVEPDPPDPEEWSAAWPGEASPKSLGMSPTLLAELDSLMLAAVADGVAPGAALAVGRSDGIVRLRGYGTLDYAEGSPPVTTRTLYDVASLTKALGTTTAVMLLVEEGRIELDAPVSRYLPWWSDDSSSARSRVTVRDLLLHRSGLPAWRRWFLELAGTDQYREAVSTLALDQEPGSTTIYSDIGFKVLGWIVEEVSDRPLDAFLGERVWRPVGMADTFFRPDSSLFFRIAPTEVDEERRNRHILGEVHDENAYSMGGVAGHAGIFSSVQDLSLFARLMLGGGRLPGCGGSEAAVEQEGFPCPPTGRGEVSLFDRGTVADFTRRHDRTASRALGWDTPSGRSSAGDYFTTESFGHTGFTGTSIWIDPELDLFVVLLTNRVNPTGENTLHIPLRRAVHDVAAMAILDREISRRSP